MSCIKYLLKTGAVVMKKDVTAETQRTQSKILFPLPLRGWQREIDAFPAGYFLFFALSAKNK